MKRPCIALLLPLAALAASPYAGDQACALCHREQAAHYHHNLMSHALEPAATCDILIRHPKLTFREGPYSTTIMREGDRSILTVTDGSVTFTAPLAWAFGQTHSGQTYVFEHDGVMYESRVSFYTALDGLDLTIGAQQKKPANIEQAAGRRMDDADARECFGCHATGAVVNSKLQLDSMMPGVRCEACHGPAAKHVAAVRAGNVAEAGMRKLSGLPAENISELCGRCHRTWATIALNGPQGVNNVRFQPYRLTNSKCYSATDPRISCVACHNPHAPLERRAAFYDSKCAACHSAQQGRKLCPVADKDCATCHMPKIELPGSHALFADHQIRIARPNEPYPN